MKRFPLALLALAVALAITPAAMADSIIYQDTSNNNNNGLNFGQMVPQILRPRLVTGKWGIRLLLLVGPAAIRWVQRMSRSTAGGT